MDDEANEPSLEGWAPVPGEGVTLEEIIERAYDYRGNVTVELRDGSRVVGFLFNRDARTRDPFVQLFDERGEGPIELRYRDIVTVRFTGRDTARGRSWEAWQRRRERLESGDTEHESDATLLEAADA